MKAVILSAGKGTRMGADSLHTPKPMQKVLGKNLIEWKLDALPPEIDEVILVVGHLREVIMDYFGNSYSPSASKNVSKAEGEVAAGSGIGIEYVDPKNSIKITYVFQDELLGTAHSLFLCKDHLIHEPKFLVMMGDDLYSKGDIEETLKYDCAMLVANVDSVLNKADIQIDNGYVTKICEKSTEEKPGHINAALYTLTPEIFSLEMVRVGNSEFGLPQTMLTMKKDIKAVIAKKWLQISTKEDILHAERVFQAEI